MRRLLYITPYFPPDVFVGAKRPLRFVRHLRRFGWEPTVLCLPAPPAIGADLDLESAIPMDVEVHRDYAGLGYGAWRLGYARAELARGRGIEPRARSRRDPIKALERAAWRLVPLDVFQIWAPHALASAMKIAELRRPDAILVNADPFSACLVGEALSRRTGIPIVQDLRDPWTLDPGLFSAKARPVRTLERWLEGRAMRAASAIVLNTNAALEAYRRARPELADRMTAIPNGFDRSLFHPAAAPSRASAPAPWTLLHWGNLSEGRTLGPVLRALARLARSGEPDLRELRVVVRGEVPPADRAEASALGVPLIARAYRAYRDAMSELQSAGALLVVIAEGFGLRVPAKLYDALAAGWPILVASEPCEASMLVESVGAGLRAGTETSLADAIVRLRRGEPLPRDEAAIDAFDAPAQTARLAALLDRVASSPRPAMAP